MRLSKTSKMLREIFCVGFKISSKAENPFQIKVLLLQTISNPHWNSTTGFKRAYSWDTSNGIEEQCSGKLSSPLQSFVRFMCVSLFSLWIHRQTNFSVAQRPIPALGRAAKTKDERKKATYYDLSDGIFRNSRKIGYTADEKRDGESEGKSPDLVRRAKYIKLAWRS